MGVFDLVLGAFAAADSALSGFIPPLGRLVIWAVLGSVVSMGIYRLLSAQERISKLKAQIAETRQGIAAYDGDFDGIRPLLARSIGLSLRQVGLSLGPAVVASIPLLFLLVWLSTSYSFSVPKPGQIIQVRITPESTNTRWEPAKAGTSVVGGWRVTWPRSSAKCRLLDGQGRRLLSLPLEVAVPVIRKREWWNILLGNPLGYLPEESAVQRIDIELPRRHYVGFGTSWLGRWETVFFTVLVSLSLVIKVAFRLH